MTRIGRGEDERVRTDIEIEDGRVTMEANGGANLYVEAPDETPLSAFETHTTLRVTQPWSDSEGNGYSAEVELDAGALDALREALPGEGTDQVDAAADGGRPQLHVGDHVQDREADDERPMLVVGTPVEQADEYVVDGEGATEVTVADYNEDHPADDDVVEVTYPQRTATDVGQGQRYAFPRSRLVLDEPIHDVEEGED